MNWLSSKKGFIFTLDLLLGMGILFLILGTSIFFISRGSEGSLSGQQLLEIGSDIVAFLDRQGVLDTLSPSLIETEMEKIVPANYGMLLQIQGNFSSGNGTMEAGEEMPQGIAAFSGRRAALSKEGVYFKVSYFMWVKQQE